MRRLKTKWIIGLVVGIGVTVAAARWLSRAQARVDDIPTFTVQRGHLTISVKESGAIKAREQVVVKNEVEGKAAILYLIPEGTQVQKGELLVELDVSQLQDRQIDQQIMAQNAEAASVSARENLGVVQSLAQSEVDKAKLTLAFARQDLTKYVEGEYPNQRKEAEAKIILATEERARARDRLDWSRRLQEEKYISHTELQADELAEKQKELDLELAQSNLDLLTDFTHARTLAQRESDVKEAELALDRAQRKAKADIVQAEADLNAKASEHSRQQDKLEKIKQQLAKSRIYAPTAGLVIYATSAQSANWRNSAEPLAVGQEVIERQELIHLPTAAAVMAEVNIHEASLDKVRIGLPARITVDALAGQLFTGTVAAIAPLPDARSVWMNPDLKLYQSEVVIEQTHSALRAGMSCKVEILVEEYDDAVFVPVQAVIMVKDVSTVYVVKGGRIEPRPVNVGLDNGSMVRIVSGVAPGEVVSLVPPLSASRVTEGGAANRVGNQSVSPGGTEAGFVADGAARPRGNSINNMPAQDIGQSERSNEASSQGNQSNAKQRRNGDGANGGERQRPRRSQRAGETQ